MSITERIAAIEDGCAHPPRVGGWCLDCDAEREALIALEAS